MHVEFRISEDDYVSAAELAVKTRRPSRNMLPGIGVLCIAAAIIPVVTMQSVALGAALFFYGLFMLAIPLILRARFRRQYRANPLFHGGRTLDVDDGQLRWRNESSDGVTNWSVYSQFAENKETFILFQQGNRIFFLISKRELSEEQITGLRSLLQAHLPKK